MAARCSYSGPDCLSIPVIRDECFKESSMASPLFKLPHEDVLYRSLFTKIHPKDLWICRRVCREFRRLCDEYFRSYCVVLDFRTHELTPGGLNALMSMCRNVRKFYWHNKLAHNVPMDLSNYKTYFWGGKQLKALELHNINLCLQRNSYIGNYCKELCILKITNCEVSCDRLLSELTGSTTKLVELDLSKSVLSSTAFSEFISNKKDLVVLKVSIACISICRLYILSMVYAFNYDIRLE